MKHLKYALIGSPWSVPPRGPSQILAIYPKMGKKKSKKVKLAKTSQKLILLVKICPLENVVYAFSPVHLCGPSELVVLHPRTLIGD